MRTEIFDPARASEQEFAAYTTFKNHLLAERWPEDPPWSLQKTVRRFRALPAFMDLYMWATWSAGEIVAVAKVFVKRAEDNRHLATFELEVLPERRRRGLGTPLLRQVADACRAEERRLLITTTDSEVPAGEAFVTRLGARKGSEGHINQLELADLDRDLLRAWQERAKKRAGCFTLSFWAGTCPEEDLASYARLIEASLNSEPWDELELGERKWTPERVRQYEASLEGGGNELWTVAARHLETGELAGYTEVLWEADEPETLQQGGTGVLSEFRNLGLGRLVKAAMLGRVLRDRPQVGRVRTGNADSNAAMLHINRALGFRPYKAETFWQVELERVQAYLSSR